MQCNVTRFACFIRSHGDGVTSAPEPDGQFDEVNCDAFFDLRVAALEADGAFVSTALGWAVEGNKIGDPEVLAVPVLPLTEENHFTIVHLRQSKPHRRTRTTSKRKGFNLALGPSGEKLKLSIPRDPTAFAITLSDHVWPPTERFGGYYLAHENRSHAFQYDPLPEIRTRPC